MGERCEFCNARLDEAGMCFARCRQWGDGAKPLPATRETFGEWQPIETAPRGGTPCLIWSPDAEKHGVSLAVWHEFDRDPDGGAWYDEWRDTGYGIDAEPTHWMPLPASPQDTEGDE